MSVRTLPKANGDARQRRSSHTGTTGFQLPSDSCCHNVFRVVFHVHRHRFRTQTVPFHPQLECDGMVAFGKFTWVIWMPCRTGKLLDSLLPEDGANFRPVILHLTY
jgi:hypothetical protein